MPVLDPEDWRSGGFGIYVHWPFCAAKCPYCDFNSHVRQSVNQADWVAALCHEIDRTAALCPDRSVDSIFFGGGTPSLMDPSTVAAVIDRISLNWALSPTCEITMEANPSSVEADRFAEYARAGVNRISLGVQALNDEDLRALGRLHDTADALRAFEIARDTFDRVSFDLIYARQHQTVAQWEQELDRALSLAIDHLSLYQLTIEDGTRFGDLAARGRLRGLPNGDVAAEMYNLTYGKCADAGLPAYEISNFAKPGAECRHNLIYWRYGDFVGIGPGAHGRLSVLGRRQATQTHRNPEAWLSAVRSTGTGEQPPDILSSQDQALEYMLMSLRLHEGMNLSRYQRLAGNDVSSEAMAELVEDGFLERRHGYIRTTAKGRPLLNAILVKLAD